MAFVIKRIYEEATAGDGYRMLVDRLWPRGVAKARAELDEWAKDIAPSTELRVWFGHEDARFDEFGARYRAELDGEQDAVTRVLALRTAHPVVTLLYGARDPRVNHALVLRDYLEEHAR
jgi:uncharacterized protein YeaO (DUF488 family)